MTHRFDRLAACWAVALGVAACLSLGCNTGSSPRASAEVSPEEGFRTIVATFRRGIETGVNGVAGGFIVPEEGGHSRLTVNNKVTDEIFPPEAAGEPYRGTITVVKRSSYSLLREPVDDPSRSERNTRDSNRRAESGPTSDAGIDVFDSELISAPQTPQAPPDANRGASDESIIARHSDEETRTYKLVHQNGRWELDPETEFDDTTELSIQHAFEVALNSQP